MAWQRVDLVVDGARAEALSEALEAEGAISVEICDADAGGASEIPAYGEPGAASELWQRCRVSALFPEEAPLSGAVDAALAACEIHSVAAASIERLEDADWVSLTQKQFEPIRIGRTLWIVPTWLAPPEPGAVNIVLDPGAAFGTGSHPTTRLCLEWLERSLTPGDTVLDYGCGSGVLAIAAMKLGAARAIAVDIDPQALETARYNSERNGVHLELVDAQRAFRGEARLTVANILANPLRMLAPVIASHTVPGGNIALSGILEEQASSVAAAYAPWAQLEVAAHEGAWVLLAGPRAAPS